jgi:hypothetical protein
MEFIDLVIRETSQHRIHVQVQKATAEHFGWDKAFPEWKPRTHIVDGQKRIYAHWALKTKNKRYGGKRLRICRDVSTTGYPAGKTHCFRCKGPWAQRDLRDLAEVAGDKFEWMENFAYERVRREEWLKGS